MYIAYIFITIMLYYNTGNQLVFEAVFWNAEIERCLPALKSHSYGMLIPLLLTFVTLSTCFPPSTAWATAYSKRL